jgi:hypothetical protein
MMDDEIAMTDTIGGIKASYALEGCIFWILSAKLLMPANLKEVYYSEDLLLDGSFLFAFKIYSLDMILAVFYFRTQLKKVSGREIVQPPSSSGQEVKASLPSTIPFCW